MLGIWLVARSVGVHLSPRPFFVLGPLLFLVMLVPFTVNGLAVREAFFVSFLGKLHVAGRPGVRDRASSSTSSRSPARFPARDPAGSVSARGLPTRRKDMSAEIRT